MGEGLLREAQCVTAVGWSYCFASCQAVVISRCEVGWPREAQVCSLQLCSWRRKGHGLPSSCEGLVYVTGHGLAPPESFAEICWWDKTVWGRKCEMVWGSHEWSRSHLLDASRAVAVMPFWWGWTSTAHLGGCTSPWLCYYGAGGCRGRRVTLLLHSSYH